MPQFYQIKVGYKGVYITWTCYCDETKILVSEIKDYSITYCRCESLAELLWRNRQQVIKVDLLRQQLPIDIPQGTEDVQPELNKFVTGLLSSLVTR